ncbi:MAG TPA: hypothetical protein VF962_02900, partial [Gemmatimonadaceae bacterium]
LFLGRLILPHRAMPAYVDLPGSLAYPHPFIQQDCTAAALVLQADWQTLRKCVDSWLNVPINRKYHYLPLLPAVFLTSLTIRRMTCKNPPESGWGWMQENDISLAIPLIALRDFIPSHLAFAFAYVLVDAPVTMSTGRETFGYRKSYGQFEQSELLRVPIEASTSVLEQHDPSCQLKSARVLKIMPPENLRPERRSTFTDARHAIEEITKLLPDHRSALASCGVQAEVDILSHFLTPSFTVAYLKQFRDIQSPEKACYQAVVESPMTITAFRQGGMLDSGFTVELTDYASYPMISDLGVVSDYGSSGKGPVQRFTPMFGFWADFDFTLDTGRIVAERGANSGRIL